MESLSWKFSVTAHGKGVVDGLWGRVKSLARMKIMSRGKNRVIVQNTADFVDLASKLCKNIQVRHLTVSQIEQYQEEDRFRFSKSAHGISLVHVMRANGNEVKCWKNSKYQSEQSDPHVVCYFNALSNMETPPIQENVEERQAIAYMDVVIMRHDPFKGYYAVVSESVKDIDGEVKINYLKKSGNKLVIAPNDLDMRPITDFKKVSARIDGKARYFVAFLDE